MPEPEKISTFFENMVDIDLMIKLKLKSRSQYAVVCKCSIIYACFAGWSVKDVCDS